MTQKNSLFIQIVTKSLVKTGNDSTFKVKGESEHKSAFIGNNDNLL